MTRKKYLFLFLSAAFLLVCTIVFIGFMDKHHHMILNKGGIIFEDPVLALLPEIDLSVWIFTLTYGSVLSFVVLHIKDAERLSALMVGYGVLLLMRMLSMTLLPLDEPKGLVPLDDPFLNQLIYPGDVTTDLFFSGHVGAVFLIAFLSTYTRYFVLAGIVLSVMLLFQHIHFSIDVLAAIPVAFCIAYVIKRIWSKLSIQNNT